MASRETSGTNVDPGLIQRVSAGVKWIVSGVAPTTWFGPSQPLAPQAQEQTEGRAFDYPVGINQRTQPRSEEAISFEALRGVAKSYDLLRLAIETRKDQIASFEWDIVPREKADSADQHKADIKRVTDFLQSPDKEHGWDEWLRMQVEDLLVLDAIAVYPRKTMGGDLYSFDLINPATLKRVLDVTGRTPLPPDPAYQQILKGIPAADYTRDMLVYKMRNPGTDRIYGYGPVEQVLTTVNIALRRQMSQLAFYTEGNVPEALAQVPATWTAKMIAEFQTWWDSVMEGNQAARRKMRFIPNLDNIVFPKKEMLKDEYDEWLARIICFAFSISPSSLIKQVNRASGEQIADTAKEEGLHPLLRFFATHVTMLIQRYLDVPDLKFQFRMVNRVAPKEQAEIHAVYITNQVLTPDEVREDLERDAMTPAQREAAFPKPPAPVVEPGQPVGEKAKEPKPEATPAEKMLADTLQMLDPQRLAKSIEAAAASQAPRVVEVRPEVNVEVGDTNVYTPKPAAPAQPMAKAAPPKLHAIRTKRMADGSAVTLFEGEPES